MIYTPLTKKALRFAYQAHDGQQDRNGLPYIFHPYHLAEQMPDEVSAAAALLHDVIEDTPFTLNDLKDAGFPPEVLEAVALLTHDDAVPYPDYIRRIAASGNRTALRVKLADLAHNSDFTRLDTITEKDRQRMEKYAAAKAVLLPLAAAEEPSACEPGKNLL